ncbi:unnamed protein product [Symbiodinium pilosum]|uniref:Peptidase A2 domain-containing protein n=1 Tax=Symbiodinium pilosum TaxID=2952 RepID=A0A812MZ72_SYMPI|nr:unnamed protein product [Symbiodinium pilosum]
MSRLSGATVVLFGAIAEGRQLWQQAFASAPRLQSSPKPLLEEDRRLMHLPEEFLGQGYDMLELVGRDEVKLNFMLDSGLTTSIICPDKADQLELLGRTLQVPGRIPTVALDDLCFHTGLQVGPLKPFVMDFPQRRIADSMNIQIDGMLGMEFYERFVVEVDSSALRLYQADSGERLAVAGNMVSLTTGVLLQNSHFLQHA